MGRIIQLGDSEPTPIKPDVDPRGYPTGSIWESDDGSKWVNEWSAWNGFTWNLVREN